MEGCYYWEAIEGDYEVAPLSNNPTMNHIKLKKERTNRKAKENVCLYVVASPTIFNKIMAFGSEKEIWDYLKVENQEDERIKSMKVLDLIKEFEKLQMKGLSQSKNTQKKHQGLGSAESSRADQCFTSIEAEEANEAGRKNKRSIEGSGVGNSNKYSSCKYCGKHNHPHFKCWRRSDVKCRSTPCHGLLLDSGCTNYMICDEKLFKNLDKSLKSRARIGNRDYLEVKEKGHSHHKGLQFMQKNEMAIGLPILELNLRCKACLTGKKTRLPVKNSTLRAKKKLQLIREGKMVVSRDVQFLKDEQWDRTSDVKEKKQDFSLNHDELMDDTLVRGIILLSEVYWRSCVAVLEPARTKLNPNDLVNKYKAKLVLKGLRREGLPIKQSRVDLVIVSLYIDDMLVAGSDATQIKTFKKDMMEVFETANLCGMHYFLGMKIEHG
ncbi:Retrovirus-related Pol polyprotein from transposon TNT 1-94 [Gossypium australe]|uniref:Retrovirus-related Pol polyprotein from transposon TNT 1-94 n=1 Tax=Gossypium australe TaxID=47621 RepID=A0A5B6UU42_9ROSI|nr:Retrovirus-related Pol polyprotein from transposon TNT 1-94 [Gossypium australe]